MKEDTDTFALSWKNLEYQQLFGQLAIAAYLQL